MKKIVRFMRIEEWLSSKVTMMSGILLFFSFQNQTPSIEVLKKLVIYVLFVSMFLAVSYVVNDYSDIEIDKKAGKQKVITEMSAPVIWMSLLAMVLLGNTPFLIYAEEKKTLLLCMIVIYFLGIAYSTMGLRFKERGVWGLIECSVAQRCMPLVMIVFLEEMTGYQWLLLLGWILLSFMDGLRYILIHQIEDLENDLKSGVSTYISERKTNVRKTLIVLLELEILLLAFLLYPLFRKNMLIVSAILFFTVFLEFCNYKVLNVYAGKDCFSSFDSVPLEVFLNVLVPIMIGFCMAKQNISILIYCILVFVIGLKLFMIKCNIAFIFVKSKIKRN